MTETTPLPAGTALYRCPLSACDWTHAELPMTTGELMASLAVPVLDVAVRRARAVENEVAAHLAGHSLLEWVQEIGRLRRELDVYGRVRVHATDAGRVKAMHPDDGTYAAKAITFPAGRSPPLSSIVAEFEASNPPPEEGWTAWLRFC